MSFFRTYRSPSIGGTGRKDAFAEVNLTSTQLRGIGGAFPGEVGQLYGNLYQMVQNRSGGAITVGQAVSLVIGDANRFGNLTAASTTSVLTTDDTLDAGLSGSEAWPGYVGVTAGAFATTTAETRRQILANSSAAGASTITVANDDFSDGIVNGAAANSPDVITTPGNTYDYEAFCPWEVTLSDLDALVTSVVQGVVVSTTIADDSFGIIQIAGVAMALVDGTADVLAGSMLYPSGTAGTLILWPVGAPDAAGVTGSNFIAGRTLNTFTDASTGLRMILLQQALPPLIPYPINP